MKLRTQLYLVSVLMILTMLGVIIAETGLWVANQKQIEKRNYVTMCLKDVFELNLLTHELNLFRDIDRPIDQMELKLETLSHRFQRLSAKEVFSTSEVEAVKSILQSIRALLGVLRETQKKTALPGTALNQNQFYDHMGAQLLQRSQTLYGAFTLMHQRLIKHEAEEEYLNSLVRVFLLMLMSSAVALSLFFLYRRVVQSFASLEAGAAEVAGGNMEFKFLVKAAGPLDEIGAVKSTFNNMIISLHEAAGEIQKKNRELETLLYVISHDLKEPLRSVEYFSQTVYERNAPALGAEAQDYLCRSVQGAVRMRLLLDDILALSKARKVTIPDSFVPTKEIIRLALERLERRIKASGAQIDVAEEFPDLRVDPTWALEAMYNLISNAVKYVRPGERPQIEIIPYRSEEASPKEAGVIVQDRGPGVPPEMAERIFGLFQRGVGREVEGTGAGLAIVKVVAERHGGRAWVEPREGGGSKFIITFKS